MSSGDVTLTEGEKFLLDWLSKEDWSSYGECYGKDFDRLSALGLVERKPSNRSREHEYFDLCRPTEAGRAFLARVETSGETADHPRVSIASAMSAGTAETQSGSGLQPASAVGEAETPKVSKDIGGPSQ